MKSLLKRNFYFFLNVIKYKSKISKFITDNIKDFKIYRKEDAFNFPKDVHGILDIEYEKEENVIIIETEYILFKLFTNGNLTVSVDAESEASKKFYMTDLNKKIFDYEERKKEYFKGPIK